MPDHPRPVRPGVLVAMMTMAMVVMSMVMIVAMVVAAVLCARNAWLVRVLLV